MKGERANTIIVYTLIDVGPACPFIGREKDLSKIRRSKKVCSVYRNSCDHSLSRATAAIYPGSAVIC